MGTLFSQPERKRYEISERLLKDRLSFYSGLAKEYKCSLSDVINLEKVLQLERKNQLTVDNYNILDEQLAGFGELLQKLIEQDL